MSTPPPPNLAVSACIICKNEGRRLAATLDSLAWCANIVIVDSGSTDGTLELAAAHPARPRIIHQDWLGFNPQRQFAAAQCRHPWVLMLDADEECTPELAREIQALSEAKTAAVALLKMPRRNYLAGRYVRCWSPDYQARLIHIDRVDWDPRPLPEIRHPKPGFSEAMLQSPLLHCRIPPLPEQALTEVNDGRKMAAYSTLLGTHLYQRGKHATFLNLLFRPLCTFLKYYILRGGFLDGRFGLIIAYKTTIGVTLKYSVLWSLEQTAADINTKSRRHEGPRR